jgi:glutaminyl-peptide cyclotransferase
MKTLSTLLLFIFCFCITSGDSKDASSDFSGERAFNLLLELTELGPRVPGTVEHAKTVEWIISQVEPYADNIVIQPFLHTVSKGHPLNAQASQDNPSQIEMKNIICRFSPYETERLLLCAHYDCRPFCDQETDPELKKRPVIGANDAGSGVVILIELARLLSLEKNIPAVDIIFFDGEDFGEQGSLDEYFLGSKYFSSNQVFPSAQTGILLDMVGDADLRIPIEAYSWQVAPDICSNIWKTAEDLGYSHIFVNELGRAVLDDHVPLIKAGIRVVDIIDFEFPEWHTVRDTPDVCSEESLEIVGTVIHSVIQNWR